jgi:hypothetical protein
MTTFVAGRFILKISEPYPMWTTLEVLGGGPYSKLHNISHAELVDLRHVVERAIAEAERRMPGATR